jgi:hypothetical protein
VREKQEFLLYTNTQMCGLYIHIHMEKRSSSIILSEKKLVNFGLVESLPQPIIVNLLCLMYIYDKYFMINCQLFKCIEQYYYITCDSLTYNSVIIILLRNLEYAGTSISQTLLFLP